MKQLPIDQCNEILLLFVFAFQFDSFKTNKQNVRKKSWFLQCCWGQLNWSFDRPKFVYLFRLLASQFCFRLLYIVHGLVFFFCQFFLVCTAQMINDHEQNIRLICCINERKKRKQNTLKWTRRIVIWLKLNSLPTHTHIHTQTTILAYKKRICCDWKPTKKNSNVHSGRSSLAYHWSLSRCLLFCFCFRFSPLDVPSPSLLQLFGCPFAWQSCASFSFLLLFLNIFFSLSITVIDLFVFSLFLGSPVYSHLYIAYFEYVPIHWPLRFRYTSNKLL